MYILRFFFFYFEIVSLVKFSNLSKSILYFLFGVILITEDITFGLGKKTFFETLNAIFKM